MATKVKRDRIRIFGGEEFYYFGFHKTKRGADNIADDQRKKGDKARIIKKKNGYDVFVS